MDLTSLAPITGLLSLAFAGYLARRILKKEAGTARMVEISNAIHVGAMAYLYRQFRAMSIFAIALTVLLGLTLGLYAALTFAVGTVLSALAGYVGMMIAIRANVRTAHGAMGGLGEALDIAFQSGAVAGISLAGLGLLGTSIMYYIVGDPVQMVGMGFGASLTALFARVGGGIFTKAADMGADLVGKVEVGIPEDDPRNPAVIADQVGDNVGDVAGTGSDVFQSYVCTLVAAMIVGVKTYGKEGLMYPAAVLAVGIISSVLGTFFVRLRNSNDARRAIYRGMYAAALLAIVISFVLALNIFKDLGAFYATSAGIVTVVLFAWITEHYTSHDKPPVRAIAEASQTGPATNILMGLATGLESTAIPVIVFSIVVFLAYRFAHFYGIAMAAVGFLSMTAILTSMSTYGPIVDNAGGIVEMSGLSSKVGDAIDVLDSVGNTTKAVCKGYAVGTSALAEVALFSAYVEEIGFRKMGLDEPSVMVGLIVGCAITFIFCSYIIKAVGKAAFQMIGEVRRQFREIAGLSKGEGKPDYAKCVDISTRAALKGMLIPSLLSITIPLSIGFIFGAEAVGGLIVGNIASTLPMALMLMHSGAAWDNAKKYIEAGHLGGKGTPTHAAAIIGDTVGDPCKDAAGPSLDIFINIIGSVAMLFATMFLAYSLVKLV